MGRMMPWGVFKTQKDTSLPTLHSQATFAAKVSPYFNLRPHEQLLPMWSLEQSVSFQAMA